MTEPTEHHLEVTRTARYWILGEEVQRPTEVWFVLHGYRQLARRFLNRFRPLADGTRWIVAPEGLSRFYPEPAPGRHGPGSVVGASWMTREDRDHEIADYVRYLDDVADTVLARSAPDVRGIVLGFSQGVATAARWTVLGRVRPSRIVLWGDYPPPDLPLDGAGRRWDGVEVTLAMGERDPIFQDGERTVREEARLLDAGIRIRTMRYPDGHDIHQPTLQRMADSET